MVKVISFDVGGTLIDTEKGLMQNLLKDNPFKEEIKSIIYTTKDYSFKKEQLLLKYLTEYQIQNIKNFYAHKKITPLRPFVGSLFALLRNNRYQIIIASNRHCFSKNTVSFINVLSFISAFFYSNEIGVVKPNPLFFKYCAEKMSINCGDILHIGDSIKSDFFCASQAGCKSLLWDNDKGDIENIYNILNFIKIPKPDIF